MNDDPSGNPRPEPLRPFVEGHRAASLQLPGQAFDPLRDLLERDPEPLRDPLGILPELKADTNAFVVLLRPVRSQKEHQELIAPGQGPAARLGQEVGRPVRVLVGGRLRAARLRAARNIRASRRAEREP